MPDDRNDAAPQPVSRGDGGDADSRARAFVREHRGQYTPEALASRLREAGYPESLIAAVFEEELTQRVPPPGPSADLRGRAATILVVVFLAVWAVIAIPLLTVPAPTYYFRPTAVMILTGLLLFIALLSLLAVAKSRGLRAGAEGALATVLVLPFVLLFVVAGLCVATENPWQSFP